MILIDILNRTSWTLFCATNWGLALELVQQMAAFHVGSWKGLDPKIVFCTQIEKEHDFFPTYIDAILKACLVPPLPRPALIGRHQTLCVCKRDTQGQWAGANQPWQLAATALSICCRQNWLRIEAVGVAWASATLSTDVSQGLGSTQPIASVHSENLKCWGPNTSRIPEASSNL